MTEMTECLIRGVVTSPVASLLPFDLPTESPTPWVPVNLRAFHPPWDPHRLISGHHLRRGFRSYPLTGRKKCGGKAGSIAGRAEETSPRQCQPTPVGAVVGFDIRPGVAGVGEVRNPVQRGPAWIGNDVLNTEWLEHAG